METAVPSGRPSGQDAFRPGPQSRSAWKAWKFAAREILYGPRGIIKMSHLWLPLSFILLVDEADGLKAAFGASLAIIIAVLAKVQFSIQVNDLSDRKEDQEAGKKRWVGFLSKPAGVLVAALFLTAGLAVVFLRAGYLPTILAYSATVLLAVAYSSRPLRFKERGILGLLAYNPVGDHHLCRGALDLAGSGILAVDCPGRGCRLGQMGSNPFSSG